MHQNLLDSGKMAPFSQLLTGAVMSALSVDAALSEALHALVWVTSDTDVQHDWAPRAAMEMSWQVKQKGLQGCVNASTCSGQASGNPGGWQWGGWPSPQLQPYYFPSCLPQVPFPCLLNHGSNAFVSLDDSWGPEQCPSHCTPLDVSWAVSHKPAIRWPQSLPHRLRSHVQRISNYSDFRTIKTAGKYFMTK